MDLYGFIGGCGAQRHGAPIYAWNPEALLGNALIKGFSLGSSSIIASRGYSYAKHIGVSPLIKIARD
jgi:hypothetical protein